jgi:superoxide dismutase, Cu-Zn family
MKRILALACGLALSGVAVADAATATVTVNKIDENGVGEKIGTLRLRDTSKGLRITPHLTGLPPGPHGFHVHANADCGAAEQNGKMTAGFAAGGHLDPEKTGKHLGPNSTEGHLGDLPVLMVDDKGVANKSVMAPRLKVSDVTDHAIVIHAGGDNYSDEPAPLGGGGPRIACAVVRQVP